MQTSTESQFTVLSLSLSLSLPPSLSQKYLQKVEIVKKLSQIKFYQKKVNFELIKISAVILKLTLS